MCYCYQSHFCDSATAMATQLLCHRTYLLHLSALSSLRNLCRSRHRLKQTTGPLYLDQNPSENWVIGQIWLFWDICSVCEVGWWIYVSIDRRPLPGRSGEDREGQHLTRISDGEWAPPENVRFLQQILQKADPCKFLQVDLTKATFVFHIVDILEFHPNQKCMGHWKRICDWEGV